MYKRLVLGGLLLSLIATDTASAQVPGPRGRAVVQRPQTAETRTPPSLEQLSESELEALIDSLTPLVEQAAAEAESATRASVAAARARATTRRDLDTLFVMEATVITRRSDAEAARDLFSAVLGGRFQGFESPSLGRWTFTYQRATYDIEEIPVDGERAPIVVPTWYSQRQAEASVRAVVGRVIANDLSGSKLRGWASGNPFTARDPGGLYREMILARSAAVPRCLDGGVEACMAALGLGVGADAPDDVRSPLPTDVRETVVALAVQRGGTGAWGRLVEDPTMAPEEALAYAAGIPFEELVAEWRDWLVSNRPEVFAGLGTSSLLSLLWILIFAALAGRSTRWRFD